MIEKFEYKARVSLKKNESFLALIGRILIIITKLNEKFIVAMIPMYSSSSKCQFLIFRNDRIVTSEKRYYHGHFCIK